jgi:hypothetical protein
MNEKRWRMNVITTEAATAIGAEQYEPAGKKPVIVQFASIYIPKPMNRETALQHAISEIIRLSGDADVLYIKSDDMRVHHMCDTILAPFDANIRLKWQSKKRLGDAVLLAKDALNRKSTIIESL